MPSKEKPDLNKTISSQDKKIHWHKISFSAKKVLAIISGMAGFIWVLYITGSFAPDIELGKEASFNRYGYERAVEEKNKADKTNQELQGKIVLLNEKLRILDDGIEKKKIETEERILNKKMEFDAKLQLANSSANLDEAKFKLKIIKLELKLKKDLAEIERQTSMVRSCVDATTPGEKLEEEPSAFGGGNETSVWGGGYAATGVFHVVQKTQEGTKVLSNCLGQYYKEFGSS